MNELVRTYGKGLTALFVGLVVAWIVGLFVVCGGYDAYRHGWEASVMRVVRPNGVVQDFPDLWAAKDHGPDEHDQRGVAQLHVVPLQDLATTHGGGGLPAGR